MAFPSGLDTFLGTTAQGTSLLTSPDHGLDHRTLGSALSGVETKIGIGASTPAAGKVLVGSGAGTSAWNTTWNNGTMGTATFIGGTVKTALLGTNQMTGGTVASALVGTCQHTGGTVTGAMLGTNTITGGTITTVLVQQRTIGSAVYTGTAGSTVTLEVGTATRHLVNMPNSAGSVTLALSGAVANSPFWVEILQGTAGLGTIGFFTTIRWPSSAPVLTTTASKKDTFVFVPTSGSTFDGYIAGQNL
jgi:hypothetical protein